MAWVMTIKKDGSQYQAYIGSLKIATIRFRKVNEKWLCALESLELNETHNSMKEALQALHGKLNGMPKDDAETICPHPASVSHNR